VNIREIEAKSILRKYKKVDSWFISQYGMNLYRGCSHNCVYCDGRSERYFVDGEFGDDVSVKVNAIDVLSRELDPGGKRKPLKRSFIMVGGGVGDSYQPVEKEYELTRKTLELIYRYGYPVHMLTKSTLIKRDIDILKKIDNQSRVIVSFSFSSADDDISAILEPGVPPPSQRLEAIEFFRNEGIACGMFLLPVVPLITDNSEVIGDTVRKASEVGVDFIIFGGMTLKEGRQRGYFLAAMEKQYPELVSKYRSIYLGSRWGEAVKGYTAPLNRKFNSIAGKYGIPVRVPLGLYRDILSEDDLVIVMLEHIDYLLKLQGKRSSFGYAAYSISQLREPLSSMKGALRRLRGIGEEAERLILEILETGESAYYQELCNGKADHY